MITAKDARRLSANSSAYLDAVSAAAVIAINDIVERKIRRVACEGKTRLSVNRGLLEAALRNNCSLPIFNRAFENYLKDLCKSGFTILCPPGNSNVFIEW